MTSSIRTLAKIKYFIFILMQLHLNLWVLHLEFIALTLELLVLHLELMQINSLKYKYSCE